jgi:dGTPase
MTHTLEVSQLSRTIARALGINEDLVEAIALGHDLGHAPFGHLGEVALNEVMNGSRPLTTSTGQGNLGGFKHNYQSLRIVDLLEKKYTFAGLNLTAQVREGILKHTRLLRDKFDFPDFCYDGLKYQLDMSGTMEGQVVAIADEIAQRTHDLEDGVRAGFVEVARVRELELVRIVERMFSLETLRDDPLVYQGQLIRALINVLVDDVIDQTFINLSVFERDKQRLSHFDRLIVDFGSSMNPLQKQLNKFIYQEIINVSRVSWSDDQGKELIFRLFQAYFVEPELLPIYVHRRYGHDVDVRKEKLPEGLRHQMQENSHFYRIICDYIAGMSDYYAVREAQRLVKLNKLTAHDLDLDVALGER